MAEEDSSLNAQEQVPYTQPPSSSVPPLPASAAPLPALTPNGLLPAGIHTATLEEVERVLGSTNLRRTTLWNKFMQWLTLLRQEGLAISIFMDGSFTTAKPLPGDIDLVVEMPSAAAIIAAGGMKPSLLPLITHHPVKAQYELDVYIWTPEVPPKTDRDLIDFFQRVRPNVAAELGVGPDFRKGIIRVML